MTTLSIVAITGLPEVKVGDDLAGLIRATGCDIRDGDIVVITSKVVSKAEGRLVPGDDREQAIREESVRVVAQRGSTTIAETRHGFVMAAAGVDASDVPLGMIALLPTDPDASARRLRTELGGRIAVIISDTFGRPWRDGLIDQAIGVAGLNPLLDLRGEHDTQGRTLQATITAIADQLASASELIRGKSRQVPAAIIRGLGHLVIDEDGPGAQAMMRQGQGDWFRYGHRDLLTSRRTVREFSNEPVDRGLITVAITAALTAPAPHHSSPLRFVVMESPESRAALLKAMEEQWRADLLADGRSTAQIDQRIARGALLHRAPVLIAPFLVREAAHRYPDERRSRAEERMFTVAAGAAIQNLLLALHGEGLGAAWISSSIFCPDVAATALGVEPHWEALGLIAVGYPLWPPKPRPEIDIATVTHFRT